MAESLYIPEVLEMVLLELPAIQTIICQRVCTTWRNLIQKSPALRYYTTYGVHLGCAPQPEPQFAEDFGDPSEREDLYYPPNNFSPLALTVLETLWTKLAPHALKTWNRPNDQIPDRTDLESAITLLYDQFTSICERVPLAFPSAEFEMKSIKPYWNRWVSSCDSGDAQHRFRSLYDDRLGWPVIWWVLGKDTDPDYCVRYSLKLAMHVLFLTVYTKVPRALYDREPAVAPLHVDPQPRVLSLNAFLWVLYRRCQGAILKIGCYKVLDPPVEVRKIQRRYVGEVRYLNLYRSEISCFLILPYWQIQALLCGLDL